MIEVCVGDQSRLDAISRRLQFDLVLPDVRHKIMAGTISQWTQSAGVMLPKTPEQILSYFEKGHSVVVTQAQDTNQPISHAAITGLYSGNIVEIGSVYTAEQFRGKGAARTAITAAVYLARMLKLDTNPTIIAIANAESAKVFEKLGGVPLNHHTLPKDVWVPCTSCPRRETAYPHICCNTAYNLTHI